MAERGVHDDGDNVVWVLNEELAYRLVELFEGRQRTAFRRNVGAVDDYVTSLHFSPVSSSKRSHPRTGPRRACSPFKRPFGVVGTMPLPAHRHREMETSVSYAVQVGQQ